MNDLQDKPILIAGPTASGKSALALALAERLGATVINTDSMQVYRELPILTAQPGADERSRAPHRLYGYVAAADAYSVGRWAEAVREVLAEVRANGRRAIFIGGTGLYFRALLDGLSPIPPVPEVIRSRWRARGQSETASALHAELARVDPDTAGRLMPGDAQRILRALEVLDATGRTLSAWQREAPVPLLSLAQTLRLHLDPPRAWLQARCNHRFDAMVRGGALDEVRVLVTAGLSRELPAMRALGVAPLADYLAGQSGLDTAVAQAKLDTGRYVKRQQTWFRKFMADWMRLDPSVTPVEAMCDEVLALMMGGSRA